MDARRGVVCGVVLCILESFAVAQAPPRPPPPPPPPPGGGATQTPATTTPQSSGAMWEIGLIYGKPLDEELSEDVGMSPGVRVTAGVALGQRASLRATYRYVSPSGEDPEDYSYWDIGVGMRYVARSGNFGPFVGVDAIYGTAAENDDEVSELGYAVRLGGALAISGGRYDLVGYAEYAKLMYDEGDDFDPAAFILGVGLGGHL